MKVLHTFAFPSSSFYSNNFGIHDHTSGFLVEFFKASSLEGHAQSYAIRGPLWRLLQIHPSLIPSNKPITSRGLFWG
jgi:hypothetical protein